MISQRTKCGFAIQSKNPLEILNNCFARYLKRLSVRRFDLQASFLKKVEACLS